MVLCKYCANQHNELDEKGLSWHDICILQLQGHLTSRRSSERPEMTPLQTSQNPIDPNARPSPRTRKGPHAQDPHTNGHRVGPHPLFGAAVFSISTLIYAVLCLSVLRHSVPWLLGYVADDAFYYLQIARHLAATGHSTFDGLNPANGYHPGWMLLMTALARIFPERVALLRASVALEFGFQFATSLLLIPIVRRLASPLWAWLIAAAWLLNPLPFILALFGVEAPFAQFTVALAVWTYLSRLAPFLRPGISFQPPVSSLAVFGFSLALAFYGRTDQALLAAVALVLLLGMVRAWTEPGLRGRVYARTGLWIGGPFVAGVLPWYLFSYMTCGTLAQDSGAMKMLWHARSISAWNIHTLLIAPLKFAAFFWIGTPLATLITGTFSTPAAAAVAFLFLLLLVVVALRGVSRSRHAQKKQYAEGRAIERTSTEAPASLSRGPDALSQMTLWLGSSCVLSGLAFGLLIADAQFWYLAIPSLTLFLLLTSWGARLAQQRFGEGVQRRLGIVLLAAALGVCVWHRLEMTPPYPWQRDVYTSEPRFEALVPASARIGCFDAGIPAYFSPRTIINLDGLVNHTAVSYWKTNTLEQYIAAQDIGYIANEPATVAHAQEFTTAPIPLSLVASAPLRGWSTGQRCLWKVGLAKIRTGNKTATEDKTEDKKAPVR